MNKTYCDRCERELAPSQVWTWHRRLPHDEGTAHFDLCVNCDTEVMGMLRNVRASIVS